MPFVAAEQPGAFGPDRVFGGAAVSGGVEGDAAADVGDGLVRQRDEAVVVGDDPGVGQGLADRGAVGRARVHRDDLHLVLPVLTAIIEPGHHVSKPAPTSVEAAGESTAYATY